MLNEDLYRSSKDRWHHTPYEEWIEVVRRDLPQPRILTVADIPRITPGLPRRQSWWDDIEDWRQRQAEGGAPG